MTGGSMGGDFCDRFCKFAEKIRSRAVRLLLVRLPHPVGFTNPNGKHQAGPWLPTHCPTHRRRYRTGERAVRFGRTKTAPPTRYSAARSPPEHRAQPSRSPISILRGSASTKKVLGKLKMGASGRIDGEFPDRLYGIARTRGLRRRHGTGKTRIFLQTCRPTR